MKGTVHEALITVIIISLSNLLRFTNVQKEFVQNIETHFVLLALFILKSYLM
jgi:hypothetical protein